MTDQRVYGRLTPDLDRLRLLEAVAEAMLAAIVAYGFSGDGSADQLHEAMAAGRKALVALEAYDE